MAVWQFDLLAGFVPASQEWTEAQRRHTLVPAFSFLILHQKVRDEEFPDCILRDQALVAKTLMESKQQKEWQVWVTDWPVVEGEWGMGRALGVWARDRKMQI